jgi:hypothetical protein
MAIVSLLHFNSDLTDDIGRTWTGYGGASINTTEGVPKFDPGCLDLGTSNSGKYIQTPASIDTRLLDKNFGIGFWYFPVNHAQAAIAGQCDSSAGALAWEIIVLGLNSIRFNFTLDGSTAISSDFSGSVPDNTWHYMYMGRDGANLAGLVNGVPGNTVNIGTSSIYSSAYKIGLGIRGERTAATIPGGLYDEFMINVGECPFALTGFTPPDAPFSISEIKTVSGVARASVKKIGGIAIASVNKVSGLN